MARGNVTAAVLIALVFGACVDAGERVCLRTGSETAGVSDSGIGSIELPVTMEADFTGNVVTTGVGLDLLAQVDSPLVDGLQLQATATRQRVKVLEIAQTA